MKSYKDGGTAFLVQPYNTSPSQWSDGSEGMTLRDYFAGQALTGLCALNWQSAYNQHMPSAEEYAENAYCIADAMIKARKKNP